MAFRIDLLLFVAADPDLDACFPGWRRHLPATCSVAEINLFAGKPLVHETWDPGRPPVAGRLSFHHAL